MGIIVNYLLLGARGLEVIPNLDFWRGLPSLVRVNIIFFSIFFKVDCDRERSRTEYKRSWSTVHCTGKPLCGSARKTFGRELMLIRSNLKTYVIRPEVTRFEISQSHSKIQSPSSFNKRI